MSKKIEVSTIYPRAKKIDESISLQEAISLTAKTLKEKQLWEYTLECVISWSQRWFSLFHDSNGVWSLIYPNLGSNKTTDIFSITSETWTQSDFLEKAKKWFKSDPYFKKFLEKEIVVNWSIVTEVIFEEADFDSDESTNKSQSFAWSDLNEKLLDLKLKLNDYLDNWGREDLKLLDDHFLKEDSYFKVNYVPIKFSFIGKIKRALNFERLLGLENDYEKFHNTFKPENPEFIWYTDNIEIFRRVISNVKKWDLSNSWRVYNLFNHDSKGEKERYSNLLDRVKKSSVGDKWNRLEPLLKELAIIGKEL